MPAPCTLPWGCFTSLGSQTSCCKQLLHPVPHLCCNLGSVIPAPHSPNLSLHTHLHKAQDTPAAQQDTRAVPWGLPSPLCLPGLSAVTQHSASEPNPAGCWEQPPQQRQALTANSCRPGPRDEQECITDTRSYPQHRQQLCSAPHTAAAQLTHSPELGGTALLGV